MSTLMRFSTAAVALTIVVASASAQNQSCPSVTPKNPQEALMMEQSSHKQGCWVRSPSTGQLVFTSSLPPSSNYKPLVPSGITAKLDPAVCGTSGLSSSSGLEGLWILRESISSVTNKPYYVDTTKSRSLILFLREDPQHYRGFGDWVPGAGSHIDIDADARRFTQVSSSSYQARYQEDATTVELLQDNALAIYPRFVSDNATHNDLVCRLAASDGKNDLSGAWSSHDTGSLDISIVRTPTAYRISRFVGNGQAADAAFLSKWSDVTKVSPGVFVFSRSGNPQDRKQRQLLVPIGNTLLMGFIEAHDLLVPLTRSGK